MGFEVTWGGENAAIGNALGNVAQGYMQGRAQVDQEKRTQAYIDSANRAIAEHDAQRAALGAAGRANAALATNNFGASQAGPPVPGTGELPQGMQGPVIHAKTGLPDYRDQATLEDRMIQIKEARSFFPKTPEGDAAYGLFATTHAQEIQGHILDNQEAESIDDLADSVASMSMGEGMEPYVQSLQGIEQGIRATKGMEPKLRAQALQNLMQQANVVRIASIKQAEKTRKITEAVGFFDQQLGGTSPFDPNRDIYGQGKALVMAGADPTKVMEKVQAHTMGLVEVEPGVYANKETARFKLQQQRDQRLGEQAQEGNALKGAAQAETKRFNDWKMTGNPPGTPRPSAPVRPMTEGQIDDVARKYVNSTNKLDVNSTAEDRSEWRMLFETKKKELRAQIGKAQSSPVPAQDLQAKFNAMTDAQKAAYLQAAGIK